MRFFEGLPRERPSGSPARARFTGRRSPPCFGERPKLRPEGSSFPHPCRLRGTPTNNSSPSRGKVAVEKRDAAVTIRGVSGRPSTFVLLKQGRDAVASTQPYMDEPVLLFSFRCYLLASNFFIRVVTHKTRRYLQTSVSTMSASVPKGTPARSTQVA